MSAQCLIDESNICIVVAVLLATVALLMHKRKRALWFMTAGVYCALVFLFLLTEKGTTSIYSVLIAADYSWDVFSLSYKFKDFIEHFKGTDREVYAVCLFVMAPVLTLSNVLALFQNIIDRLRYVLFPGTKYILSELNDESIALAKSIREKHSYTQIIFAGVGNPEKKHDTKLLEKARELSALCLKQDVSQLHLGFPLRKNLIFLISRHEPENVADALALIEKYRDTRVKIDLYVYASSPESKLAIDAVDKGKDLLDSDFQNYLNKEMTPLLNQTACWDKKQILDFAAAAPLKSSFAVHIVDIAELTVQNVLREHCITIHNRAKCQDHVIGITILGFGKHGAAFLKNAVWFFQFYGHKLQFNIFDLDGSARRRLEQEAPELLHNYGKKHPDDASHDIQFLGAEQGIDCLCADFDELFLQTFWNRMKNTQLVLISLGDDSKNIAVATHIRKLFQRKQIEEAINAIDLAETKKGVILHTLQDISKNPNSVRSPVICAVVRDQHRAENLISCVQGKQGNQAYCNYHIEPIGMLHEAYDFKKLRELMDLEKLALRCHLLWSVKDILNKKAAADAKEADKQKKEEKMNSTIAINALVEQTQRYLQDSYYRDSSIAMAIHQVYMLRLKTDFHENERTEKCMITEHMRWNAYMRSKGYQKHEVRNDRVKLHPLIVPYHKLSPDDKEKDLVEFNEEEIKCIFPNLWTPPM